MTAPKTFSGSVTVLVTLCLAAALWSSSAAAQAARPPEQIAPPARTSAVNQTRAESFNSDRSNIETGATAPRRAVGAVTSADAGIGVGEGVDLTWDDAMYTVGHGRHIDHWWNGLYGEEAAVSVHFSYRDLIDSTTGGRIYYSGYNVYDAVGGPGAAWPRGQDIGCDLQLVDPLADGDILSLDVMPNGRVVMGGRSAFYRTVPGGGSLNDHMVFYQAMEFNCSYDPRSSLNVTWIDSSVYRPLFLAPANGAYTRAPQVVSQWDGTNTVVHLILCEDSEGLELPGDDYAGWTDYHSALYFRKVGATSSSGTWSAGQVIDSLWAPFPAMAAAPYPHTNVAVTYTNVTYHGGLMDNHDDLDVWLRESPDRGLTWPPAEDITNYQNGISGDQGHFTAWLETQPLYTTDGDLQIIWTAKPTSHDPYFDGFNWSNFNENIYHWARSTDNILQVAFGSYDDGVDYLTGGFNTLHCGFGGMNAGYIAHINLGQCDDKLYCVWNQIHERAADHTMPWIQYEGVLDDCSYNGSRLAKANWEIMMAVMAPSAGGLWDTPRNISNTYTPDCGLAGDPEAQGLCGSEYKPSMEKYGFDESGLSLTWPTDARFDPTPAWEPPYAGTSYLNIEYLDDQNPGPAYWGKNGYWTNPPATLNSVKWLRLACVEPIYASQIAVLPPEISWPEWVPLGTTADFTIAVMNNGNVTLNVTEIGANRPWLGHNVASFPFQVPAGINHTATFNVSITAPASPTQWLDGEVWLKSDAANNDSISIPIHVLAAADVEQVRWDTVSSHPYMFDPFFDPTGECVALAVSNHGEMGLLGAGSVNLDYTESGLECDTRTADAVYLKSGSPFVIIADASIGTGAELTVSYMDADQADETGWDPSPDKPMSGGSTADYDSVFAGKFVNRDTTIAMERTFYAPRSTHPATDTIDFVVCRTVFYSADGAAHNHVTVGNVVDWNVPSDSATYNAVGVSGPGFVYVQGTDTVMSSACQDQTHRFAAEVVRGKYSTVDTEIDSCMRNPSHYGTSALSQSLLQDTGFYRDGTPLVPAQPNPRVWWEECGVPGLNTNGLTQDQAVWLTYEHDYNLSAADTVIVWTILTTVRNGSLAKLVAQVAHADIWYRTTFLDIPPACLSCCVGHVGNTNGWGDDVPTIGDISVMIDAKFITGACILDGPGANIRCLAEADINQSGGWNPDCDDITIGDISRIIDCLFITGLDVCGLPMCLYPN